MRTLALTATEEREAMARLRVRCAREVVSRSPPRRSFAARASKSWVMHRAAAHAA